MNVIVIFIERRWAWVVMALALVFALGGAASADMGDSAEVEAQRLVHILEYVAGDYAGAVKEGAAPSEYVEQIALLDDAARIASRIKPPPDAPRADLAAAVARVRALFDAKAPDASIAAAVASAKIEIVSAFRLVEAPTTRPDRARGKQLFTETCAECHGPTGRGDTAKAATLKPHPANFHDPAVAEPLSPARVFSTVRFGINGTAMVPFTNSLGRRSLEPRLLRDGPAPGGRAGRRNADLRARQELASRSDADLEADLRSAGIDADRGSPR